MRQGIILLTIVALFSILFTPSSALSGTFTGSIITPEGKEYKDVSINVDNSLKFVTIRYRNIKKKLEINRIQTILDDDGNDVTHEITEGRFQFYTDSLYVKIPEPLGAQPDDDMLDNPKQYNRTAISIVAADKDTWHTETSIKTKKNVTTDNTSENYPPVLSVLPEPDTSREIDSNQYATNEVVKYRELDNWKSSIENKEHPPKMWDVGCHFGLNYDIPVGEYYDGVTSGLGFDGDIMVAVTHNIAIRVILSSSGLGLDNSTIFQSLGPSYPIINQEHSLSSLRFVIGGQYYHINQIKNNHKSITYIFSGIGFISHKLNSKLTYHDNLIDRIATQSFSDSKTNFMTYLGVGAILMISKNIGLDIGLNHNLIYVRDNEDTIDEYNGWYLHTASIIEFKLAFVLFGLTKK